MSKPEKCFKYVRDSFFARPIASFEQVFVSCSRSSIKIKIQQFHSKLIKHKLLDEIFGEMSKKSISLNLNFFSKLN